MARNIILFLIAMVVEDVDEAIDCIIHVWYSSFIRKSDLQILQKKVKPQIQMVCYMIDLQGPSPNNSLVEKIWDFGSNSFKVVLQPSEWKNLLTYFDIPHDIRLDDILTARKAEMRYNIDRDDLGLAHMPVHARVSVKGYLDSGILLPFGSRRDDFTIPNPQVQP